MDNTSVLGQKLSSALASRDKRLIRRRLPDPLPSTTTTTTSSHVHGSGPPHIDVRSFVDFTSNDYLSLTTSPHLRTLFLKKLQEAPEILGSGGSRLLVNGVAHDAFERRMERFFDGKALLFNSGFDANVAFFSCIPQPGDAIVYDEFIHASVHDGMRASRVEPKLRIPFAHNDPVDLKRVLESLRTLQGTQSIFISVESLYSMDGTLSPIHTFSRVIDEVFPLGSNIYIIVDEAHATGLYGTHGRGRVAQLGLQGRVLARLHTFGKALGASGAVIVTSELVRDYLINYARPLIYTTSMSYANVIAAEASFDLLEDGTADQLSKRLFKLSTHLISTLTPHLASIPPHILSLPNHLLAPQTDDDPTPPAHTPIIPLLTAHPRPLASFLRDRGMNARPITWPTVPKGKGRVRICLRAGLGASGEELGKREIDILVQACVEWAKQESAKSGRSKM